ncbi:PREDICTED: uncharacterized protein LOC109463092, partial [Branchiostoma belcheri]|uniref:Uncharacterized protein LOC109463092 n=1 Tax=Branchiostoma belcheri TaxID=7741 RepID=A0A6P4XTF7_BRABE
MTTSSELTTEESTTDATTTNMTTASELTTEESTTVTTTDMTTSSELTTEESTTDATTTNMTTASELTTEESTTDATTTNMTTASELTTEESTTDATTDTDEITSTTTKLSTTEISTAEPFVSNPSVIITVPEIVPANDLIDITAVIAIINVVIVPVQCSMEFPGAITSIDFYVTFLEKVTPYYSNTEGYQGIKITGIRPVKRRRRNTPGTKVYYEVEYNYKELSETGGVKNVSSRLENDVKAGNFAVEGITAKQESLSYPSESEIRAAAIEAVIEQVAVDPGLIEGGLCAFTNCSSGYECQQDETSGNVICAEQCTNGYCYNEGTCIHLEKRDIYC